jgi:hypothetical protein
MGPPETKGRSSQAPPKTSATHIHSSAGEDTIQGPGLVFTFARDVGEAARSRVIAELAVAPSEQRKAAGAVFVTMLRAGKALGRAGGDAWLALALTFAEGVEQGQLEGEPLAGNGWIQ